MIGLSEAVPGPFWRPGIALPIPGDLFRQHASHLSPAQNDGQPGGQPRSRRNPIALNQLSERFVWLAWVLSEKRKGKRTRISSRTLRTWLWGCKAPANWRTRLEPVIQILYQVRVGSWADDIQAAFDDSRYLFRSFEVIGRIGFEVEIDPSFFDREAGDTSDNRHHEVFLPAHLGRPDVCASLSTSEKRLLQTIYRRLTLAERQPRRLQRSVRRLLTLDGSDAVYVTLRRRPVGRWLQLANYRDSEPWLLCCDLASLADRLGLLVAAIRPSGEWITIQQLAKLWWKKLWKRPSGIQELEGCEIRLYAPANWLDRWQEYFGWPPPEIETLVNGISRTKALPGELRQWMTDQELRQLDVAKRLHVSPAYVSRILHGQRCPKRLMQQIRELISQERSANQVQIGVLPTAKETRQTPRGDVQ